MGIRWRMENHDVVAKEGPKRWTGKLRVSSGERERVPQTSRPEAYMTTDTSSSATILLLPRETREREEVENDK